MTAVVSVDTCADIALIKLDIPPVNAMNCDVRAELLQCITGLSSNSGINAVILTGTGQVFSGGVDIREFGTEKWERLHLADICEAFESYPGILIMGLNGVTLGGGLEIALTADYRVAHVNAVLGLPEVCLGLIPGAGGTQRLPRRIDPEHALEMIVSGETIPATMALKHGLVDHVVDSQCDFQAAVINYAQGLLIAGAARRRCTDRTPSRLQVDSVEAVRRRWGVEHSSASARHRCIEMVQAACRLPLSDGLRLERQVFEQLMRTPEHRALRHIFFAERAAAKVTGVSSNLPAGQVSRIGIVGAGTMGTGIALAFLSAGLHVTLVDNSEAALKQGLARIKSVYKSAVERKRLTQAASEEELRSLLGTTDIQDVSGVDLVIEAVYENYELKKHVLGELDRVCDSRCILASNTSTLDLNRIAEDISRPANVVGLHFFSPAHVMRLLEIVRTRQTSTDVIRTCLDLAKRLRKVPVVVGVGFGFVGNRMMEPYTREAQRLLLEGASPSQVDGALTQFGMAMGPLAVLDLAGLDVTYQIRQSRRSELAADPSYAKLGDELYALGRFGQKTGRGYYRYEGRQRFDDPEVVEIAEALARSFGIRRRAISDREVQERCVYSLINEGARVLEEGVATRASDCDVVYVHGYGFPAWRGGPMHYADEIGLATITDVIERYRNSLGAYGSQWFQSSDLLKRMAASGERFATFDNQAGHS